MRCTRTSGLPRRVPPASRAGRVPGRAGPPGPGRLAVRAGRAGRAAPAVALGRLLPAPGTQDQLLCVCSVDRRYGTTLAFNRSRRGFTARDREIAELVTPHWAQAMDRRARLTSLTSATRRPGTPVGGADPDALIGPPHPVPSRW